MIPFEQINAAALAALPSLLADWFPAGKRRGHEYVLGNLRGDPGESLSINVNDCKWADFASEAKGGDPISLLAAARHGGDRVAAAKELGRITGVYLNGEASPHIAPVPPAAAPKEEWQSSAPPPGAAAPDLSGFDHVYSYADASGSVIRYVGRKDAHGGRRKLIIPITWGTLNGVEGWHRKHPSDPRCLYGLDRLAAMPERVVIICEGEKAADAARAMLPDYPCITWSGGTQSIRAHDWSPLSGRQIIIWPDNDAPGHKAAAVLRKLLTPAAAHIETLRVDDLPEGADAADVSPSDPVAWLRARIAPEEAPDYPEYADPHQETTHDDPLDEGVIPLGHDRGVFYYYSRSARQVLPLAAGAHTKNALISLASVPHYWQRTNFVNPKSGAINWDEATDWLMRECRRIGIYDTDRIRGRGAWIDNGRAVLHVGDRLIVDGTPCGLVLPGSRHIYEAAKPLTTDHVEPISTTEAHKLVEICRAPNWQQGISGILLAGFIVVAPVCGGLAWRPSIWITGGAGSGKSYLKDNILAPAMGGMALLVQSKTTEAGIRQSLNCDARPVLFDEAEREDPASASRMQGVLDLLRQSSSEGGAEIVKGSQSQTGAKRYRIRSCFAFSSINVGVEHQADESRITVLALRERDPRRARADEAKFAELNRVIQATITPDFAAGLLSRSVRLLPVIRANAETFARAVSVVFGSRRAGDQLGALLAGAYALHSTQAIGEDAAEEWVRKQEWTEINALPERDETRLLSYLTQHPVKISRGNGVSLETTIGRVMQACDGSDHQIARDEAMLELKQRGIKFATRDSSIGFWVSTNHPAIAKILAGTPWSAGWTHAIGRLPGAVTSDRGAIRFAFGHISKAAWLPWTSISGEDGDAD